MIVTRTKVSFSHKDYICFLAYIFCGFVLASFFPIGRPYCTTKIEFNSDGITLQETHLLEKDTFRVKDRRVGQAFHNNYNKKKREVSILFSKHLRVHMEKMFKDDDGRLVVLRD
uniref:Uncharacterized protein n=1 Tax=Oryzias sinensis TaxID=183150 RepID=A0A8C7WN77_9TELE